MHARGEDRIELAAVASSLHPKPGTYCLLFEPHTQATVAIGSLGRLRLRTGVYAYVGSALGSGGVRARVARHCRLVNRKHWHVDFLRASMRLRRVLYTYCDRRLEHAWASALLRLDGSEAAMVGFGASDCRCQSHLTYYQGWPDRVQFGEALKGASPREAPLHEILIA